MVPEGPWGLPAILEIRGYPVRLGLRANSVTTEEKVLRVLPASRENRGHQVQREEMEYRVPLALKGDKEKKEILAYKDCLAFQERMALM